MEPLAFLQLEGRHLDRRDWDAWLALYEEDALYWVPAWKDEDTPSDDPDTEVSLIYHQGRAALEDRVWRVRSQRSVASIPLARTTHMVGNVIVAPGAADGSLRVEASWTCHTYDPKRHRQHVFFGLYDIELRAHGESWRYARKKVLLQNDYIPTMIDFYCL